MLAKTVFGIVAAVMVGCAAYAPPEAAAKGERFVLAVNPAPTVGPLKIEAPVEVPQPVRVSLR